MRSWARLGAVLGFLATYVALGEWSLRLATVHVSSSPVWPPAGLAIGFLALLGLRYAPAVLVASFLVNLDGGAGPATTIAAGNTLEAMLAGGLIRRAGGRAVLEDLRGVGTLIGAAGAGALVSAVVGVGTLVAHGTPLGAAPDIGRTWALGNLAGSLLVVPWMLALRKAHPAFLVAPIAGFATGIAAFWSAGWTLLLLVPALAWATQKTSRTGVTGMLLGLGAGAVTATLLGRGPFVAGDGNEALLLLQMFLVAVALTSLILAAGNRQRRSTRPLPSPMLGLTPLAVAAAFVGLIVHPTIVSLDGQQRQAEADALSEAWEDAALRYGDRLLAVRALYDASDRVERDEFDRFIASQDWVFGPGGSTAIGFARAVSLDDVATYEAAIRNDTTLPAPVREDFTVFPPPMHDAVPVDHVYPMVPQPGAIGVDLRADADGRWALDEATRTDQIIATAPKDIISPTGDRPGFFLSLPVDTADGPGFVVLAQTVEDMAAGIPPDATYRITDITAEPVVLHATPWNGPATHQREIDVWGRVWLLEMQVHSELPPLDVHAPWFVVGSGAVLSVAVAAIVYSQDTTKARATAMSRDLVAQVRIDEQHRMEIERLRERDKVRRDFLNMVAHELRTPLMPIRAQTYLLRKAGGSPGLDILDRSVDRLNAVVDDLLDASRLEAKGMRLARADTDLADLCQRAVCTVQDPATADGTQVRFEGASVQADVDEARIAQVLDNLLSNALKFAPGGHIDVRLHDDGDEVRIEVCDDGQGIDPAKLPEVGEPFAQVHAPKPGLKGTGLGLYICRAIAHLHGGDLHLDSKGLGQGTQATLRLPKKEEREEAPVEAKGSDAEE